MQIKSYATVDELVTPWIDAKLPVTAGGYNGLPIYTEAQQVLTKDAGLFNPFKSFDPTLNHLMTIAENAPTLAAGQADWAKVMEEVVELGVVCSHCKFQTPSITRVHRSREWRCRLWPTTRIRWAGQAADDTSDTHRNMSHVRPWSGGWKYRLPPRPR